MRGHPQVQRSWEETPEKFGRRRSLAAKAEAGWAGTIAGILLAPAALARPDALRAAPCE